MIDEARALLTETIALIERRQYEVARLTALRNSLEAFLEQPGAEAVSPAPAATPRASTPAPRAAGNGEGEARAPSPTFACADCSFTGRTEHSVKIHRSRKHAMRTSPVVTLLPAPKASKETFLCSRNCGRTFPTRERLMQHETQSTCTPMQTRPPTTDARKFVINGKASEEFVEGLGE